MKSDVYEFLFICPWLSIFRAEEGWNADGMRWDELRGRTLRGGTDVCIDRFICEDRKIEGYTNKDTPQCSTV